MVTEWKKRGDGKTKRARIQDPGPLKRGVSNRHYTRKRRTISCNWFAR